MTDTHYLVDILILLAAAIVAVPIFRRLGMGSVLGYLAAGASVGPWGFGFIEEIEEIRHIAEFGVVFLLFIIGIELKPDRLWAMRRMVFGLGTAQVLVTGFAIAGVAVLLGQSYMTAVVIGFSLALSSTAFVLQILNERGELGTVHGHTAFSVLLLQDLAVVPLLALVSLLATKTSLIEGVEFALLDAVFVLTLVVVVGRYLLSPLLRLVAASAPAEVFIAAAVFAVLGTAWLMEAVGLSLAMGAFMAGVMMAESDYRHQVIADIQPFRGILLGLFFMGVGMSIDFGLLGREGGTIVALVLGLLVLKAAILWGLCRLMGVSRPDAGQVSLMLSQSGEFGFVLFGLSVVSGVLTEHLFHILTLLVALSMVTTPLMTNLGERLRKRLSRSDGPQAPGARHTDSSVPHVIIAGFGRVGRRVAQILQAGDVPYLAIERDTNRVMDGKRDGYAVSFGDASQARVLESAGAGHAGLIVCTLDQPLPATRLVKIMRQHYPDIRIYARGRDRLHCEQLQEAGASIAISETLEASLQISAAALDAMGIVKEEAAPLIETFRKEYYRE